MSTGGERWRAVAFCTPEFEEHADGFADMVIGHGGQVTVVRMPSTGSWERNTGRKPQAILDAWWTVTEEWLLYLDIDAEIHARPVVRPDLEWDVGLVGNPNPNHKNRVAAAAIFLRTNEAGRRFVQLWRDLCEAAPGIDHPRLTAAIAKAKGVRFAEASRWLEWTQNGRSKEKEGFKA